MKSIMAELGSITAGMMEKQEDTITSLTAENKRMAVEVEAWRGGRLWLTGIDLDGPIVLEVEGRDGPSTVCNTITEAVDALMKEE